MEATDLDIIRQVRDGNRQAFRHLVDRHSRGVFRLAFRMTGNEADAEEAVQETFLRAYRQLGHYESRASFSTWIHRIAVNHCLDRARSRKPAVALSGPDGETVEIACPAPRPDRLAYAAEVRERLGEALANLTPQERAAFILRHYEGRSIEEIGSALDVGVNAAKHAIFRAVRKLRRALEPAVGAIG